QALEDDHVQIRVTKRADIVTEPRAGLPVQSSFRATVLHPSGYRHPTVERSLLRCAVGPDRQGSRASSTLQGGRNNRIQGVPALLIWSSASRRAAGGT